jgi:AraC-like DNA-binding protein
MHDKLTIIALKHGNIKLHLQENELMLKEKNIGIVNPYQMHSASKIDKNSDGLYALYLDKNWIEKLQHDLFNINKYISFQVNIINDKKTYDEFILLCENLFLDDICIKKEELLIEYLSKLMIENCNQSLIQPKNILACDIKSYIDRNINSNLTLEEISNQFLITPFHLIRIFKKELNLTPYQYILNQKINLAKELLSKDMTISEIALSVGFNDQSHLYKYFKQIFSISPREYQDSLTK